jgi:DNA-binding SARP family transcriptional activator
MLFLKIWPDAQNGVAQQKLLNNAVYKLHQVLQDEGRLLRKTGTRGHTRYELADQRHIWIDVDACETLLRELERLPEAALSRLALLQEIAAYFARGAFLAQEEELWCYGRRAELARKYYRCRLQLAEAYSHHGQFGPAEEIYNALLAENPAAEEVLEQLMRLYHAQGLPHLAWLCYQDTKNLLEKDEGLQLSPAIEALAEQLRHTSATARMNLVLYTDASRHLPDQLFSSSQNTREEELLSVVNPCLYLQSGGLTMKESRRLFLYQLLGTIGSTMVLPFEMDAMELQESLLPALRRPSFIDAKTLATLEAVTNKQWEIFRQALKKHELLPETSGHLQTILRLLRGPLTIKNRQRLSTLAGETAQLAGEILFDARDFPHAEGYYRLAILTAQESGNAALQAAALGRLSFLPIYQDQAEKALPLLDEASSLVSQANQPELVPWLAVIRAEAYACSSQKRACQEALEVAEHTFTAEPARPETYWTRVGEDSLLGYQGVCYLKLEDPTKALAALQKASSIVPPYSMLHQSIITTDLAAALCQSGEIEEACTTLSQSLLLSSQISSLNVQRRIGRVRKSLNAWQDTPYVKQLDEQITSTVPAILRHSH